MVYSTDLSIATITLVRDEPEEILLREALEQLAKHGITVYVTDGGSNDGFTDFLQGFSNFVVTKAKRGGVWAQAGNSLSAAYESGSAFILYTEPDKKVFFEHGLHGMLKQVSPDEQTGIITVSRSAAGFASFPDFQQMTETTINNCCREIIGNDVDYTYGPFIMSRQLVPYLAKAPADLGWGWRPFVMGVAHRLGYRVEAFTGDFFCPAAQRVDSAKERIYRMRQLKENIQGLVLATGVTRDI